MRDIRWPVLCPSEALLAQTTVEAFDESLLILLVRSSKPMSITIIMNSLAELALEFTTTIGLNDLRKTIKASQHTKFQKDFAI